MKKWKKTVALFIPFSIPKWVDVMEGIEEYIKINDKRWSLIPMRFIQPMQSLFLRDLDFWNVNGAFVSLLNRKEIKDVSRIRTPVVNLSSFAPPDLIPSVMLDSTAVGRMAAEHLLDCGLRRFGYVGYSNMAFSHERYRAFMERVGEIDASYSLFEFFLFSLSKAGNLPELMAAFRDYLQRLRPPVGILAADDPCGSITIATCIELGLRVPEDIAVIGVENIRMLCERAVFAMSSVEPNAHRTGYEAAALLDRIMAGVPPPKTPVLIPPSGIAARASTDVIAFEDPQVTTAVSYIREHIGEVFGVERLVRILSLSRSAVERRFRKALRCTPHQYLCRMRVERAKELLVSPENYKLQDVAQLCGFSENRRFRIIFQQIVGCRPAEYSQRHREISAKSVRGSR